MVDEQHAKTQPKLLLFGEVLFDCFAHGKKVLGGAPFNVAWSLRGFGHAPYLISAIGNDAMGQTIMNTMQQWGLNAAGVQTDHSFSTGEVHIVIEDEEPHYDICQPRAWDNITLNDEVSELDFSKTDMLYHGTLALRSEQSRSTFDKLLRQIHGKRFFDVNLRSPYYSKSDVLALVQGVDWLKVNIDEFSYLLGKSMDFDDCVKSVVEFRSLYNIANVLVTGGAQGALISGGQGEAIVKPAPVPTTFVDAVGAGDAFAATTIHGIMHHWSLERILAAASQFAAKVCAISGATTNDKSFYNINQSLL